VIAFEVQQMKVPKARQLSRSFFSRLAKAVDEEEGRELEGVVSIAFLSAPRMRYLTKIHKKENHTADILTFPFFPPRAWKEGETVGEIVLCSTAISKQAKEQKQTYQAEAAFLLSHGLRHLLGDTHATVHALAKMIKKQQALLKRLGITYVYDQTRTS
jgi:rRNA maturation RNase YbeY